MNTVVDSVVWRSTGSDKGASIGPVKVLALIPRRPDLTSQQFHDHYRHPHGTTGRYMDTMRRYVQSHQIHTDLLGTGQARFDAIAELWFDNEKDTVGFREHPIIVKYIIEDEPRFIDMEKLQFMITDEEVIRSRPAASDGLSDADTMWSPDDRPFSIKLLHFAAAGKTDWTSENDEVLGKKIGALRHVRCWPRQSVHGDTPPYAGVQELWWPTLTTFKTGIAKDPKAFSDLINPSAGSFTMLAQAERFT